MNCESCKHWKYRKPALSPDAQALGDCTRPGGPRVEGQQSYESIGPITYNNWTHCVVGEPKDG
jgi:hypothetical protein